MAYADDDDLDAIYGKTNVDKWADTQNLGQPSVITARRAWALQLASDRCDARLRRSKYLVPLEAPIDGVVVDLVARSAGVLLYDSRGLSDQESAGKDQLKNHREYVNKTFMEIEAGTIELGANRDTAVTSSPRVIRVSDRSRSSCDSDDLLTDQGDAFNVYGGN